MIRKFSLIIFCAIGLFTINAHARANHSFAQGLAIEYELPPNDPQVFSNIFFWTVSATCTVISEVEDNLISINMLRKAGAVNGIELITGDSMNLFLHPGDQLKIRAESGSKVELTNLGTVPIKTSCTTG